MNISAIMRPSEMPSRPRSLHKGPPIAWLPGESIFLSFAWAENSSSIGFHTSHPDSGSSIARTRLDVL